MNGFEKEYRRDLRVRLIEDKILMQENDVLVFQTDHIFSSPSAASTIILARSSNGWNDWKNKQGKTLDELKRK